MLPREVKQNLAKLEKLELQIRKLKLAEEQFDEMKSQLYDLMEKYNAVYYITNGGLKFTKVSPSTPKTEIVVSFDIEKFKNDHPKIYKQYVKMEEKTSKGRKGYVKMSFADKEMEGV